MVYMRNCLTYLDISCKIMELWIARDLDTNELWCYDYKPLIDGEQFKPNLNKENCRSIYLPKEWFPEVTFEKSPKKIKIEFIEK